MYEPGKRSDAWQKMRLNRGQESVIGGYTVAGSTFDALVLGYYEDNHLMYAGRTRNGFTPAVRTALIKKFKELEINECPFANLPESKSGRWSEGLTAEKMKVCRWLKPVPVGEFEFLEWTADDHLRHSRFVAYARGENRPACEGYLNRSKNFRQSHDQKVGNNISWRDSRAPKR